MISNWQEMTDFQSKMNGESLAGAPQETRIALARDMCNALFMEVAELQDSFQWKPWRKGDQVDRENIAREIVDCLFFLHHIGECFSLKPSDLEHKYNEVMANNRRRYHDGDFSGETEDESQQTTLEHINVKINQLLEQTK